MAKKKNDGGKSIIHLNPGGRDENIWDDDWDEDMDDWDEDMDEMPEEIMNAILGKLITGGPSGMTDAQFKAMLRDDLENWKRIARLAEEEHAEKTAQAAREQIEVIKEKMDF